MTVGGPGGVTAARAAVEVREVLPRDGFQDIKVPIPAETKVRVIQALHAAGLRWIEVTSMVHARWVPQFEDAETVAARVRSLPGLRLAVFVPNRRGLERARQAQVDEVSLAVASTESLARSNFNMSRDEGVAEVRRVAEAAMAAGLDVSVTIGGAFGCPFEGALPEGLVVNLVRVLVADGIRILLLADTTAMASAATVRDLVGQVAGLAGSRPLGLGAHFHGGLGALGHVVVAAKAGARLFDSSLGGVGGCPFVPDAPGNVPTEAVVEQLAGEGYVSGLDPQAIRACATRVRALLEEVGHGRHPAP